MRGTACAPGVLDRQVQFGITESTGGRGIDHFCDVAEPPDSRSTPRMDLHLACFFSLKLPGLLGRRLSAGPDSRGPVGPLISTRPELLDRMQEAALYTKR